MHYRVHLRRESEQVVEFDTDDFPEALESGPVMAASELADPSCWWSDGDEVDEIETSEDGETWTRLRAVEVVALEKEASRG